MNIVEKFQSLSSQGNHEEALPLIEDIISKNESMSVSWFNYGSCLSHLERHSDSASAYLKAYELDPKDGGALYRGCLSLASDNDGDRLFNVFQQECAKNPGMMKKFTEEIAFDKYFKTNKFEELREKYRKSSWWMFWK